jgi:hypothetical protein
MRSGKPNDIHSRTEQIMVAEGSSSHIRFLWSWKSAAAVSQARAIRGGGGMDVSQGGDASRRWSNM